MIAWVALVHLCAPEALECGMIGAPYIFSDEQSCWLEAATVSQAFQQQGYTTQPYCHQISLGVPA